MKKQLKRKYRTKIYAKATLEKNEVIYTGIEFGEFIQYLQYPIENLMIITGGGLELVAGRELVKKLAKEDIYNFGNFGFVDYSPHCKTSDLSEEQIAELLYLGYRFKPLYSPFFDAIQNKFAYLSHDDGWYCKLFCRNQFDFISVLCKKIMSGVYNVSEPSEDIKKAMLQLATEGLLVDLDEISHKKDGIEVKLYIVGEYSNMDIILNDLPKIKKQASKIYSLICNKVEWNIGISSEVAVYSNNE